jgi:hypothetical protein
MASLCRQVFAEFYPPIDSEIGYVMKNDVEFLGTKDKRRKAQIIRKDERLLFSGDDITRFSFFMVYRSECEYKYYDRYVSILSKSQRSIWNQFDNFDQFCCGASRRKMKASIGQSMSYFDTL